jgi:hypothetical protein
MNAAEREALIDQYEDGFLAVSAALEEISEAELEAREAPGEWSPREVIHHLADSEMTSAITRCFCGRPRGDNSDLAPSQRGAVVAGRHAQRERLVLGRGLAAHLRRPCPRPRRSDPPCTSRGGEIDVATPSSPTVTTDVDEAPENRPLAGFSARLLA